MFVTVNNRRQLDSVRIQGITRVTHPFLIHFCHIYTTPKSSVFWPHLGMTPKPPTLLCLGFAEVIPLESPNKVGYQWKAGDLSFPKNPITHLQLAFHRSEWLFYWRTPVLSFSPHLGSYKPMYEYVAMQTRCPYSLYGHIGMHTRVLQTLIHPYYPLIPSSFATSCKTEGG